MHEVPKRVLIYTRVSRDDSGEGKSNARQEEACRVHALHRGWQVVGVEADISISAYSGKARPAWDRVLKAVEANEVDVVLAWNMDRITRTVRELLDILDLAKRTGVDIAAVSGDLDLSNEMGMMVATILGAVAQAEVERKSARQRLANQQRAAEGLPWSSGFRAFGYSLDGELVASEAEAIRTAATDALAGVSMREIARRWDAAGFRSVHARGDAGWTGRGVRSLLINPRYAGIATYKGEVVGEGQWTPIVTIEEHAQLIAFLTDPKRTNRAGTGRAAENLLTGLAVCYKCEATVNAKNVNGKPSYACQRGCVGTLRSDADAYVGRCVEIAVSTFGPRALFGRPGGAVDDGEGETVEDITARRRVLTEAFLRGDVPGDEYGDALADLTERAARIEARTDRASRPGPVTEGAEDFMREYREGTLNHRRTIVGDLLSIRLHPKGKGRRRVPIEEQVQVWIKFAGETIAVDALIEETEA